MMSLMHMKHVGACQEDLYFCGIGVNKKNCFLGNIVLTNCFSEDIHKVLNEKTKKVSVEVGPHLKV